MPGPSGPRRAPVLRLLALLLAALAAVGGTGLAWAPASGAQQVAQAFVDDTDLGWGDTTLLQGSGWAPGKVVEVILYLPGGRELARPVAAEDGTITATLQIPDGLGSSTGYKIVVQGLALDGGGGYVEIPVTIRGPEPTVRLADTEVGWGESVGVTGLLWKPGTTVDLSLAPTTQVLATATVGEDGRFSTSVQIPEVPSSTSYQLVATGQGADELFHYLPTAITILGQSATMSVSETTLAWEQTTRVRGDLFQPGSTASIHLLPQNSLLGEATVGADRAFDVEVRIPSDLASSRSYQILVSGGGADGQLALLATPITIIGPQPFMDVVDVTSGGQRMLEITGHRFLRGTTATITLLPGSERLGEAVAGPDDTFTVRVTIPADVAGPDPHVVVVTGQGVDRLFAFLAHQITLGTADGSVAVGGAVPPPGRPPRPLSESTIGRPLRSPLESVLDGLRLEGVAPDDESADELFLALFLLLVTIVGGWVLHHALRSDLGEALERQWLRLRRMLPGA